MLHWSSLLLYTTTGNWPATRIVVRVAPPAIAFPSPAATLQLISNSSISNSRKFVEPLPDIPPPPKMLNADHKIDLRKHEPWTLTKITGQGKTEEISNSRKFIEPLPLNIPPPPKMLNTAPKIDLRKCLWGPWTILTTKITGQYKAEEVIEIGAVKVFSGAITTDQFHAYINPQREISRGALFKTGVTLKFLKSHPPFNQELADRWLKFMDNTGIVSRTPAHLTLLNAALTACGHPYGPLEERHAILDILTVLELLCPHNTKNKKNDLGTLCRRYKVNAHANENRVCLKEATLLARVFCAILSNLATPKTTNASLSAKPSGDVMLPAIPEPIKTTNVSLSIKTSGAAMLPAVEPIKTTPAIKHLPPRCQTLAINASKINPITTNSVAMLPAAEPIKTTNASLSAKTSGAAMLPAAEPIKTTPAIKHLPPRCQTLTINASKINPITTNSVAMLPAAEPIKTTNASLSAKISGAAVYLKLMGISEISTCYTARLRRSYLDQNDSSEANQKTSLYIAAQTGKNLKGAIVEYNCDHWRIEEDIRNAKGIHITLKNAKRHLNVHICQYIVMADGKEILNHHTTILVQKFNPVALVFPYYNKEDVKTGAQAILIGPNADALVLGSNGNYRDHEQKGITCGSTAIIFPGNNPSCNIYCVGIRDMLAVYASLSCPTVMRHFAVTKPDTQNKTTLDCSLSACASFGELKHVPVSKMAKKIHLVLPNDGCNPETHQALIDGVSAFLDQKLSVEISLPFSRPLGEKLDFNSVLITKGVDTASHILCDAVPITSVEDIAPATEPLQLQIALLRLKQQISKTETWLYDMGRIYIQLQRYRDAEDCYKKFLKLRKKFWGPRNNLYVETLRELGRLSLKRNDYSIAFAYFQESLEIQKALQTTKSQFESAKTLQEMGTVRAKQRDYTTAISYYEQSLANAPADTLHAIDELLSENHLNEETLLQIARLYATQEEYPSVLTCYAQYFHMNHASDAPKTLRMLAARARTLAKTFKMSPPATITPMPEQTSTTPRPANIANTPNTSRVNINDGAIAILAPARLSGSNSYVKSHRIVSVLTSKFPTTIFITNKISEAVRLRREVQQSNTRGIEILATIGKIGLKGIQIPSSVKEIKIRLGALAAENTDCNRILALYAQKIVTNGILKVLAAKIPDKIIVTDHLGSALAFKKILISDHKTEKNNVEIAMWFGRGSLDKICLKPSIKEIILLTNNRSTGFSCKETLQAAQHFLQKNHIVKIASSQIESADSVIINLTDIVGSADCHKKALYILSQAAHVKTEAEAIAYCDYLQANSKSHSDAKTQMEIAPLTTCQKHLYEQAQPIKGSIGNSYFRDMGVREPPSTIRFTEDATHQQLAKKCPAILASFTDNNGHITGIYIRYLFSQAQLLETCTKTENRDITKEVFHGCPQGATVSVYTNNPETIFIGNLLSALTTKEALLKKGAEEIYNNLDIQEGFSIKACLDIKYLPSIELNSRTKQIILLMDNAGGNYDEEKRRLVDSIKHFFVTDKPKITVRVVMPKTELGRKMPLTQVAMDDPAQVSKRLLKATKITELSHLLCYNLPVKKKPGVDSASDTNKSSLTQRNNNINAAREIYTRGSLITEDTPVAKYFIKRGIKHPSPDSFRWCITRHPKLGERLPTVIIPLVKEEEKGNKVITGIHRIFCNFDGSTVKKVCIGEAGIKKVPVKLALGQIFGSMVEIYNGTALQNTPVAQEAGVILISEGIENSLVARDAMLDIAKNDPMQAQEMYASLNISDTFAIRSCVGVSGLIGIPLDRAHTVVILADNDGYNADVKYTLTETVKCFLRNGLLVKIVMPRGADGQKLDLNDIYLNSDGTVNTEKIVRILSCAVPIHNIKELGDLYEPLQTSLQRIVDYSNSFIKEHSYRIIARKPENIIQEDINWLKNTAKLGNPHAQLCLGFLYLKAKKPEKAFEWYQKAAEEELPEAQNSLGSLYLHGLGAHKNEKKAYELYQAAAEQGHADAQNNLAFLLLNGIGTHKDEDRACQTYQEAAKQGHGDAQNALAFILKKNGEKQK